MKGSSLSGTLLFYCAYDSGKDKKYSLAIDKDGQQIFSNLISPGNYTVKIEWKKNKESFYAEKKLRIL
jgi:hypothetical protein